MDAAGTAPAGSGTLDVMVDQSTHLAGSLVEVDRALPDRFRAEGSSAVAIIRPSGGTGVASEDMTHRLPRVTFAVDCAYASYRKLPVGEPLKLRSGSFSELRRRAETPRGGSRTLCGAAGERSELTPSPAHQEGRPLLRALCRRPPARNPTSRCAMAVAD